MKDIFIEKRYSTYNLATIGDILCVAGVNIEGICMTTRNGLSAIHILVKDDKEAKHILEASGITISEISEVYVLQKDDKMVASNPGYFGRICRKLADNGVKINFGYSAENNRFVFGVDSLENARELLG